MKTLPTLAALVTANISVSLFAAEPADAITAGFAAHNRAVHLKDGWVRDPYIIIGHDNMYYFTGTTFNENDPREKTDPYNTGLDKPANAKNPAASAVGRQVRVWRSNDMASWESLGVVLTHQDSNWYVTERKTFDKAPVDEWKIWAPEIHWVNGHSVIIHTTPRPLAPKVGATMCVGDGPEVKGPWSNPLGEKIGRRHDPSLFHDDDGTWWMIWGATEIASMKPDLTDFTGAPIKIGPSGENAKMGHEGCFMRKIGKKYVLFGTGWSTGRMRDGSYNLYYATADKITGPYSERKFAGRFLGHGTAFQDKQGRWWCTAFYNSNVLPLSKDGIQTRDLSGDAYTINPQGLTIVPLDVKIQEDGDIYIRAIDPAYATPGPDEAQKF